MAVKPETLLSAGVLLAGTLFLLGRRPAEGAEPPPELPPESPLVPQYLSQIAAATTRSALTALYNAFEVDYRANRLTREEYMTLYDAYVVRWSEIPSVEPPPPEEPPPQPIPGLISFSIAAQNWPTGVTKWLARWSWNSSRIDSAWTPITSPISLANVGAAGKLTLWFSPPVEPFYSNSVPYVGPLSPVNGGSYTLDLTAQGRAQPDGRVIWIAGVTEMKMVLTQAGVTIARGITVQISALGGMWEQTYFFPVTWGAADLGGVWPSSFSVKYFVEKRRSGGTPGQVDYYETWWIIGPITYTPVSGEYLIPYESGHEETFR